MSKEDLPSIDDLVDNDLPSVEDFITEENAEELPSVKDYVELEENTQTIEDADGNTFAEVQDIVPPWPELVRMINDVRADIPDIPEVKYYDKELEDLAEQISNLPEVKYYDREVEAICEQVDFIREQIKDLPEVKYYDEQVDAIEDRIDTLQTEVTNLPEVKYYDAEIAAICEAIDAVKASIPKFPKWVNEVNEVPDFSWIGKTFSVIDDDFVKVNDTIEGLRGKVQFDLEQLSEDVETKHFNSTIKIENDISNLNEKVDTRIDEEKEKIWKELRSSSLKMWEYHKEFKDDDRKLKKQILGEYNTLKQNINKELKEINYTSTKTDELLLKYFTELREEISGLPEVKYYDKDIDYVKSDIKGLYKIVEEIKSSQKQLKEEQQLLAETNIPLGEDPPETDNPDPLTPLNQDFVTLDQLQKHYKIFVERVQYQLSSIGGGGAGFIKDLDDVTFNESTGENQLLIYNGSKWVGIASTALGGGSSSSSSGVGIQSGSVRVGTGFTDINFTGAGVTVVGSGTTVIVDIPSTTITRQTETSSGVTTDFTITGGYTAGFIDVFLNGVKQRSGVDFTASDGSTVTMTPFISDGDVVEFQKYENLSIAGITSSVNATNAFNLEGTPDITVGNLTGVAATFTGVGTVHLGVGSTTLLVDGDARVTGILTVGSGSITLDPTAKKIEGIDEIIIGTGTTVRIHQDTSGEIAFSDREGNQASVGIGTTVSINTTGIITASQLAGSGASLTALNASNLGSGTIPDARFPATLPAISGQNLTGIVTGITAGSNITVLESPSGNFIITSTAGGGGDTVSIESSATDILSVSSGAISADDAGSDKLVFWDDSESKLTYLTAGSGLSISGTTITASGGSSGISSVGIQSDGVLVGTAKTINFAGGVTVANDVATVSIASTNNIITSTASTFANINSTGIVTATKFVGDLSDAVIGRWAVTNSGSSAYLLTGPGGLTNGSNSTIYLARGQTYEFNVNASGHPFQIRTSDGGSAYSTGVTNNGAQSGVVKFEVPFAAPNTLVYQCTNHSGMLGNIVVYPSI